MPGTPHSRRRARAVAASALPAASIEAWPAVGGGLLLGMTLPALAGPAPLRHPIKNLFLRIAARERPTLIVPYVRLEAEVLDCAAALIAAELDLAGEGVAIDNRVTGPGAARAVADLCPACELGLALIAAAARSLLAAAAAESMVRGPRKWASFSELAGDAALIPLPRIVILVSGRPIQLRPAHG